MIRYIREKQQCRSQYIAAYFGDDTTRPCGICDNCLNRQQQPLTTEEFKQIHQRILSIIGPNSLTADEVLVQAQWHQKRKSLAGHQLPPGRTNNICR